jgi:hypothetical protein
MDKEVINELIMFLKERIADNCVQEAWKINVPMFTGFTGYTAAKADEKLDEFEEKNIELKNKKYNEAIRYLEALSDFSIGD